MSTENVPILQFEYKNYKGVTSIRNVIPYKVWFGSTDFYKEQWLLHCFDVDHKQERNFAMREIIRFL